MNALTRTGWFKSAVFSASVMASLPAAAATLTASSADINNFSMVASTGSPSFTYDNFDAGTGFFTVAWDRSVTGDQSADVGTNVSYNTAAGDVFKLVIHNDNENPWNFQLVIDGVAGAAISIVNGTSAILSYVLSGGPINSFAVRVSGDLPIAGNDRTAEFSVSAVPIPPALLLFGSGILGLSLLGRRRQKSRKLVSQA